jgi:hypothetical protein
MATQEGEVKMDLPVELRPLVDRAIVATRELIEKGGELPGTAFIDVNMADTTREFVVIPMSTVARAMPQAGAAQSKDVWAQMVNYTSRATEARFVLTVSEVWYLDENTAKDHDAIVKQYGSLQDAPMALEGVHIVIETHAGMWMGIAPLTKAPDGRKSFGEVKMGMMNASGRLVGLLGSKPPARH